MAYKQSNSPIKQTPWVNPVTGVPYSTIQGVSNRRSNINNTIEKPINTPKPTAVDRRMNVRDLRNEIRVEDVQQPITNQVVNPLIKTSYNNINNNINNMSYDNTTGPRPMAPINPKGFSNTNNIQQMFGGAYGKSPLAQVDVDPLTGQPIDPLYNQSQTQPLVPDPGSAMSPPQVPFGVQQPITPPYGLSN